MAMISNRKGWTRPCLVVVVPVLVLLSYPARSSTDRAETAVATVPTVRDENQRQRMIDVKAATSDPPQAAEQSRPLTPAEFLVFLIAMLLLLGFVVLLLWKTTPETMDLSKEILKGSIIKAVENNADLRAVKQIYFNREQSKDRGFAFRTTKTHYPMSIPLSVVLEDIRTDLFIDITRNKELLPRFSDLIAENLRTNPFDQLEPTQKDQFERLREKIGDGYDAVRLEVTKIAESFMRGTC